MSQSRSAFMHQGAWQPSLNTFSEPEADAYATTGTRQWKKRISQVFTKMVVNRVFTDTSSVKGENEMSSSCSSLKSEPRSILVKVEKSKTKRTLSMRLKRFSAPAPVKRVSWADAPKNNNKEETPDSSEEVNKIALDKRKKAARFSTGGMPNRRSFSSPFQKTSFNSTLFEDHEEEGEAEKTQARATQPASNVRPQSMIVRSPSPTTPVRPPARTYASHPGVRPHSMLATVPSQASMRLPTNLPSRSVSPLSASASSSSSSLSTPAHNNGTWTPPTSLPSTRASSIHSSPTNSPPTSHPSTPTVNPLTTPLPANYNPLSNYLPCLHPNCTQHYHPTSLPLSFYSPQPPYNLHRKHALCPAHATTDLKIANQDCKTEYESKRQNAGRRTLRDIASDFDAFVKFFDAEREKESRALERRQRIRVLGHVNANVNGKTKATTIYNSNSSKAKWSQQNDLDDEDEGEGWWMYAPRPCTTLSCTSPSYSPFSVAHFSFYNSASSSSSSSSTTTNSSRPPISHRNSYSHSPSRQPQPRSGYSSSSGSASALLPLPTLCPPCATKNLHALEKKIQAKREDLDDEEFVHWLRDLKSARGVEGRFWERAQARVVRERGLKKGFAVGTVGKVNGGGEKGLGIMEGGGGQGSVKGKGRSCAVM